MLILETTSASENEGEKVEIRGIAPERVEIPLMVSV